MWFFGSPVAHFFDNFPIVCYGLYILAEDILSIEPTVPVDYVDSERFIVDGGLRSGYLKRSSLFP